MPIRIQISYPDSNDATKEEIAVLKGHEDALKQNLTVLTNSSLEKYAWIVDEEGATARYFALKCLASKKVLFTKTLNALARLKPDDLIYELQGELNTPEAKVKKDLPPR